MTPAPGARKAILNWPRRSLKMSTATDKRRKALGQGLAALLPPRQTAALPEGPFPGPDPGTLSTPTRLPIDSIQPNPLQPRVIFQADRLEELASSIRANGIIQPLIVRRHEEHYQIVAGERRWRAARLAGLAEV